MESSPIITILFFIFLQCITYLFIITKKNIFEFYDYKQIQKTHNEFTPRIGGLIIFLIFYLNFFISQNTYSSTDIIIFLNGLLIIFIATKEDLFSNVSPMIRFLTVLITSVIVIINLDILPNIDIFFIKDLFEIKFFSIIFFALCLALISNGINIIDGLNGHAALSIITSILCLMYLNIKNDIHISYIPISLLIFLLIFFIFNFPFGKLFLGDAGAYWLGWFLAIFVVNFFAKNNDINSWYAVIIFFYPAMEVLFSFSRKIIFGQSPFKPDLGHIHLKMYHFLNSKNANPLATLALVPLTIFPLFYIFLIENFNFSIAITIVLQIIIYFCYFIFLPKPK